MSKKIIILKPRLDIPFKKMEEIPKNKGKINNLRNFYLGFISVIKNKYQTLGYNVEIIEKPLWEFNKDFVGSLSFDEIFIPHHGVKTFDPNQELNGVNYYMQMVFPWLFQVDKLGWCADASVWPIKPANYTDGKIFNFYKKLALSGASKFLQPDRAKISFSHKFILFLCQIPHDQTIKLHSKVSVESALLKTIEISKKLKIKLIVKLHPVNLPSMEPIIKLIEKINHNGNDICVIEKANIHDLIESSVAVFSVNSGGGMEALLHNKPVFCFGRSDYASVSHFIEDDFNWSIKDKFINDYPNFFESYHNAMINVGNIKL